MTIAAFAAATAPAAAGIAPTAAAVFAAERPVIFDCQGERLLGIVHPAAGDTGVVVIVGGPQYRTGSHRLFVQLARALAASGHPVLRFDVRGMGDSTGAQRSFEDIGDDIGAAIGQLQQQQPQVRRVVLWGLCDGASAALLYLHEQADERVKGLCLLNPWVRSEASLARTQVKHYYAQRLLQRGFWTKLLHGGISGKALRSFWHSLVTSAARGGPKGPGSPGFQQRMARQWAAFDGSLLLMLSDADYTAREFEECLRTQADWRGALQRRGLQSSPIQAADHTLSTYTAMAQMNHFMLTWLRKLSQEA
jgi:exosortase A-associated hydrolase 1